MKWKLNTYLLFVSWVDSILIILLYHILHSWNHHFLSNDKMNKRFFKNWVFHIPHRLRDLLLNGESLIFNCSHLLLLFLLVELKVITYFWHTFFTWMNPMILGGHSRWLSPLLHTSSSTASSCYAFWIFIFFNCFLKVIFRFMFFHSNSLVKESNISFCVFREDTCGIRWSSIESTMIFLALTKFFLSKALASSPPGTRTTLLM